MPRVSECGSGLTPNFPPFLNGRYFYKIKATVPSWVSSGEKKLPCTPVFPGPPLLELQGCVC